MIPSMLTGLAALEATDWAGLHHAYGEAWDTPVYLRSLVSGDAAAQDGAMKHLWSAILHQGTPWTATGPAALVVAGILLDPGYPDTILPVRLRVLLTSFLAGVADVVARSAITLDELERQAAYDIESRLERDDFEALFDDEDCVNAFLARAVLGCRSACPTLEAVMVSELDHPDHQVRMQAAAGAVTLAGILPVAEARRRALQDRLARMATAAAHPDERSALVLALGDLGSAPAPFLADPSPAVRLCTALAPALAADDRATKELLAAAESHADEIDGWFADTPPQFSMRPRFAVVRCLLARVGDFDRLAPAATAVARATNKYCVDQEWGPLLAAAFAGSRGAVRTEAQRGFLEALVGNGALWDPTAGNARIWFHKAGLPYDRAACAAMLVIR